MERHVLQTGQVIASFTSCKNKKTFKIVHNTGIQSKYRKIWTKKKPVFGHFSRSVNNGRSGMYDRKAIPTCRYFAQDKHRFNRHVKFTLIEIVPNTNKPKESIN